MAIARMRTVNEVMQLILKEDPDSAATQHFVRKLCTEKKIKHFNTGKKLLVDYDDLLLFLSCGSSELSVD